MNDTKKRIMHLIERYGSARTQEEFAGARDAPNSVLKRHYDAGKQAWDAVSAEIDLLLAGHNPPAPPASDPRALDSSSCAKGDSNPHGVTH